MTPFDWILADTHLFEGTRRGRPKGTDERIIAAWREKVGSEQSLLFLGDLAAPWPPGALDRLLATLPGRVTWIAGNWDGLATQMACSQAGWEERAPFAIAYGDWILDFSHEPVQGLSPGILNVHGHFHPPAGPLTAKARGDSFSAWEVSPQNLNLACYLHRWSPVPLAEVVDARLAALAARGG